MVESLLVIKVETHCVTDKVLGAGLETELFVDNFHAILIEVDT